MSADCCGCEPAPAGDARQRRILWAVLVINLAGFAVEAGAGLAAHSASLQADALDFLGDAANYVLSLAVLGMALRHRARAALAKAGAMGAFGLWVIASTVWYAVHGTTPEAGVMGGIAILAFALNVACLALLTGFRRADANLRSAWMCSRNDVIGNAAVLLAAAGVFGTGTKWPDLAVAAVMAGLALWSAARIARQALGELSDAETSPAPAR